MKPMGEQNPGRPNFNVRPVASPFAASPQSVTPFMSSGPVAGPDAAVFRPTQQNVVPGAFHSLPSAPIIGSDPSVVRPSPPARINYPSIPQPSYIPPAAGPFQRFPKPQFPPAAPLQTSIAAQQVMPSPIPPPSGQFMSPASSFIPQPNLPSAPIGYSSQSGNYPRSNMNYPQSSLDSTFPGPRQVQPSFPGYPSMQSNAGTQAPQVQSPFPSNQGGYVTNAPPPSRPFLSQGGYVTPSPPPTSFGLHSRDQTHQSGFGPPTGSVQAQGLIEDFSSLSLGSVSGSIDPGVDSKALPRPLEGDVEPNSYAELYPMNCSSRYLRLTTGAIPNSHSLVARWHLPLGAVVCPLAEAPKGEEIPVVSYVSTGIVRCRRCRTYVNPYVAFTDGGRKWRCNICLFLNEVPGEYFAHLDANGRRVDLDQRPELTMGSVEFIAPTEYMVRPPMPPLYFFLIDVSASAVRSGMVETVAQTIRSCLDKLPGFPRTQVGFVTFDSTIHFYNMKSSLTQPQMMVVSDLDDVFAPLPDDLLANLSESRTVVDAFLDGLPLMFQDTTNMESAFGPALKAAFMILSQLGGKLLIFQNTLPSLGVGRLKLRGEDHRVYGTDKEYLLRVPEDSFYKQMAADCTKYQIAVNLYAFSDKYTDIASLGTLAKYTGGQVNFYPSFHTSIHKEKLRSELSRDLTRETAWESVMRIRCGKGVRFSSYHGNFMLRSTDLLALPAVDCDKAFAMQLSLEDTLLTTPAVYFQVALVYTASSGERRIRVHTTAAPVVADLGEMYRHTDTGSIVSLFCRLAIEKSLTNKLEDARNVMQTKIVKAFKEYRNLYAVQHRLGGRMIYPESLKFLLLYGLALAKSAPLRGGADIQLDERSASGHTMMTLPVKRLLKLLYPSLIRIDEYLIKGSSQADDFKLKRLPLAAESLDPRGLYIYDDGFRFDIWFGKALSPDFALNLLGAVDSSVDLSKVVLCERDNEMLRKLTLLLQKFRERDPSYFQLCHVVIQGKQPRESYFLLTNLIEDQIGGSNGYADWVLQIYRQIQQSP